jgi:hypothetical protein
VEGTGLTEGMKVIVGSNQGAAGATTTAGQTANPLGGATQQRRGPGGF